MLKKLLENISNLGEAAKDSGSIDAIVKKIAKATDENDHTGSWIILCKDILKNNDLVKAFDAVNVITDYWGHLSNGAKTAREELVKVATEEAKRKLSKEDWEKVNSAF